MDCFELLSEYYDEFVSANYDKIAQYIHQKINSFSIDAKRGVDLGCGSGTLTFMLSDLGYDLIGIDCSNAMLSQAVSKNSEEKQVLFIQQNMTEIELCGHYDFMISSLDCINYLDDIDEVITFFGRCNQFLRPDGLLIFDFNTLYKYAQVLDGQNFVYETEQVFCVWENEFDGKNMHYDLTYFTRAGRKYERCDEYQKQTYFSPQQLISALEGQGFEVLSIEDDYEAIGVHDKTQRMVITAQKRRNK